ncbi:MAG TPA: DUF4199 domain-containing protein [Thermoanaerobaculia bacterium]|nr:DUF4199 domain-containing protein [Thermoanaerobaculia bacterium]
MKRTVWKFGLISGAILAGLGAVAVPLWGRSRPTFEHAVVVGYTIMVLSFLLVFFGIRSYREETGGAISFGKAFQVGILVTLVACVMYVAAWEVVCFGFMPDFGDKYAAAVLGKMKTRGESAERIEAARREMEKFVVSYRNPVLNAGMTFLEVFPVGLAMTLLSAGVLRKKAAAA